MAERVRQRKKRSVRTLPSEALSPPLGEPSQVHNNHDNGADSHCGFSAQQFSMSSDRCAPDLQKELLHGRKSDCAAEQKGTRYSLKSLQFVGALLGVVLMVAVGHRHAVFMATLHENQLWFSNIMEVEREISFRTESGLYYSYYKQMLKAPSISQGLYELRHDNITEHLRTINILERFNIYQEVVLSIIYRSIPALQGWMEPIFFYINSVFALHAMLVCGLYVITWMLTDSWLGGALTACFYIFNRVDTTRVEFVIPLRESFALPFLWCQLAFVTWYFKPDDSRLSKFKQISCMIGVSLCTFLFAVTWQFAQFVLLLQAMALFGAACLHVIPLRKVKTMYIIQVTSLVLVCILQFGNKMIPGALVLSFIPAAFMVLHLRGSRPSSSHFAVHLVKLILHIILVFVLMFVINRFIKFLVHIEEDEHIYKFVLAKFGRGYPRDFDARLYLCNAAFYFLPADTFTRLTLGLVFPLSVLAHLVSLIVLGVSQIQMSPGTKRDFDAMMYLCEEAFELLPFNTYERLSVGLVFPVYALVQFTLLMVLAYHGLQSWSSEDKQGEKPEEHSHVFSSRPELAFHAIQCVFFGAMAMTTLRMKYLWTPYMCILGSLAVSDFQAYRWCLQRCRFNASDKMVNVVRHSLTVLTLAILIYISLPPVLKDLEELREFYDPDTVDLMEWIKAKTPKSAVFSGSMQLLAGVKLCTGRSLTNHPHYEDKGLRIRTKELYQMYARRTPKEVHDVMKKYEVSYIILEDSICLIPSDGCRLRDIMDLDDGFVTDSGKKEPGLIESTIPRFCNEVRHQSPEYSKYFKAVFENRTFRVYRVV